ncbi:MAG: beta-lactamase family protein [Pseudomonadota bacterium]|nr:beta-lactamase family protein [Pseudomonadota bacterium]
MSAALGSTSVVVRRTVMTIARPLSLALLPLLAGCAAIPDQRPSAAAPLAQVGVAFGRDAEVGSFAEGLADPQTGRRITADDPVRVASITKLAVAVGVMRLVEQGRLNLDGDVSATLGWRLRNPAFPHRPISLRMLLSHTSSVRDGIAYWEIGVGDSIQGTMTEPKAWAEDHPPGGYFTYSNLNFPIVASLVERVTGERFDRWMRAQVLEPMKLDACMNWLGCSQTAIARAVVLMQDGKAVRDDLGGKPPACPAVPADDGSCDLTRWRAGENGALFSPQGGLRISARGLARIGRMLLGAGTLDGVRILSPQSVESLLAPLWRFDRRNGQTDGGFYCSYGMATHWTATPGVTDCRDNPAGDGIARVGHAGEAYGLLSGLWIDRARGTGVAYYVTGLAENPPPGRSAYRAAEEAALRRTLKLLVVR